MFNNKNLQPGFDYIPEENIDLEATIRNIYRLISEIDKDGYSYLTEPIKRYIEKSLDEKGAIKPTRVNYLEKIVNKIYYDVYKRLKEVEKSRNNYETDLMKRDLYIIPFEGEGYYGPNYIKFIRIDEKTWQTSEIGEGYTTTCSKEPSWLKFEIPKSENWQIIKEEGNITLFGSLTRKIKGKIAGIDVTIYQITRRHENGFCWYYELEFNTEEDAYKFAKFLLKKETESQALFKNLK